MPGKAPNTEPLKEPLAKGMTLRDYFAGQALAGICALDALKHHPADQLAREAYEIADAMMEKRE